MRRNTSRLLRIVVLFVFLLTFDSLPLKFFDDLFFVVNGLLAIGFFLDLTIFLFLGVFVMLAMQILNGQISFMILPFIMIPLSLKVVSQYTTSKERVYLLTMFLGVVATQSIYVIISAWPGLLGFIKLVSSNAFLTLVLYVISRNLMIYEANR